MLQWGFERTHLLSSPLVGANVILGGVLLFAAGVYQLTPIKHACLGHCRSPHAFLGTHWRQATLGALRMGLEHGAYCVGCCWLLMVLLFVGGVMNLVWIAGLAIFVLLEKLAPCGAVIGRASGLLMIAAAGYLLLT